MTWFYIILAALIVATGAYVWMRQRRHPITPGKPDDPEVRAQSQGKTWGSSAGSGF